MRDSLSYKQIQAMNNLDKMLKKNVKINTKYK